MDAANAQGARRAAFDAVPVSGSHQESEAGHQLALLPTDHVDIAPLPVPLTRTAQREAGQKARMRVVYPVHVIGKDKYAEALLIAQDAIRCFMNHRFSPGYIQEKGKEALDQIRVLITP